MPDNSTQTAILVIEFKKIGPGYPLGLSLSKREHHINKSIEWSALHHKSKPKINKIRTLGLLVPPGGGCTRTNLSPTGKIL
jgi:hypothetical protein